MARTVQDRVSKRLAALERLRSGTSRERSADATARRVRTAMWNSGPNRSQSVRVRAALVLRYGRESSPLRELPTKGAAAQMQLLLLFTEQSRKPKNHVGTATAIPVADPKVADGPCWRHLVALPTETRGGVARSARIKRLDQIRNTLDCLHEHGKIELDPAAKRALGRHDGFVVQNESQTRGGAPVRYRVPATSQEEVIAVPATFFTNGWVHALTPDETITYLFLLYLHQARGDGEQGMALPNETWEYAFDKPRAHLEAYRMLFRMGLIRALRHETRREDGTVPEPDDDVPAHRPFNEMTFYVDLDRLDDDGVTAAIEALGRKRDGYGLDSAFVEYWQQKYEPG